MKLEQVEKLHKLAGLARAKDQLISKGLFGVFNSYKK